MKIILNKVNIGEYNMLNRVIRKIEKSVNICIDY